MIKIMTFTMAILLVFSTGIFAQIDSDNDGILDDGDLSGVVGDNPCAHMQTINCDDNCTFIQNPLQEDFDRDGIGEACCCVLPGDVNLDGMVNILDAIRIIQGLYYGLGFCYNAADVDANCNVNILDITYLTGYLYKYGPAPL